MGEHNIGEYVNKICQQMRWKKARQRVYDEMTTHITDSRDAYMQQGLDELAATEQAITDTGDAEILGASFDRVHRPKAQWGMIGAIVSFLLIGIVVGSLMQGTWPNTGRLAFTAVGLIVMLAAYFLDYTILGKQPWIFFAVFVAVMVFVAWSPNVGRAPGQALFLSFPLMFAVCVAALRNMGTKGAVFVGLVYLLLCFLSFALLPSAFVVFAVVGIIILLVTIWKDWFGLSSSYKKIATVAVLMPFAMVASSSMIFSVFPLTASRRLAASVFPHLDPYVFGFAGMQARRVLSGAVLFGEGAGSFAGTSFLPDGHSNFFLTSVAHYYGWVPLLAIIGVIVAFVTVGIVRSFKQKNSLGFLVSLAVILTFAMQAVAYIAYNFGVTLMTTTLPLISPGNSSLLVNMGLLGFMLSVFRTGDIAPRHICPQPDTPRQVQ